jgi:hypothetical protein
MGENDVNPPAVKFRNFKNFFKMKLCDLYDLVCQLSKDPKTDPEQGSPFSAKSKCCNRSASLHAYVCNKAKSMLALITTKVLPCLENASAL